MGKMTVVLVAALAMALAGCASDPYATGMRYQDGGYYSPASDGRGDYYVAPDYRDDYSSFGDPFYDPFVFGPSWYGGGYGYCSVRYRYCPSGWIGAYGYGRPGFGTSLWLSFGRSGFYEPWGYSDAWAFYDPWIFYARSRDQTRRYHRPDPREEQGERSPPLERGQPDPDAIAVNSPGDWAADSDSDGDGRQDDRALLRRRMLRAQPVGQPAMLDAQQQPLPWFDAQVRQPDDRGMPVQRARQSRGGGELMGGQAEGGRRSGDDGARSNSDGGTRSSASDRNDSGSRRESSSDSGQSSRGRRRERDN